MSIFDIFRIKEIRTALAQTQEERDSLKKECEVFKKLVPESDLYRQLKNAVSLLEKQKIEIAKQVKNFEIEAKKRSKK